MKKPAVWAALVAASATAGAQEPQSVELRATETAIVLRHDGVRAEVSTDGGVHFESLGAGPFSAATMSPEGRVYLARGSTLLVRSLEGRLRARRIPLPRVRALAARGDTVVALDYADRTSNERVAHGVAISRDGGRTFRSAPITIALRWHRGARVEVQPDGIVALVVELETDVCGGGEWEERFTLSHRGWRRS